MYSVRINTRPIAEVTATFDPERLIALQHVAPTVRAAMRDQVVWNINTGIAVGGAHEMIHSMLSGIGALGVEVHWVTFDAEPEFLTTCKRLHNWVYGRPGDGRHMTEVTRSHYETLLGHEIAYLRERANPGDIAIVHDPQTAGLIPYLKDMGCKVVWRCHLGTAEANEWTRAAWDFLRPYVAKADTVIVSQPDYAPDFVPDDKLLIMSPSIDGNSTRNIYIDASVVDDTLVRANIVDGNESAHHVEFRRQDGATGAVRRHFDLVHGHQLIPADAQLVTQVSRWDRLKDMRGVLRSFVEHRTLFDADVHLALVGPNPGSEQSDPEAHSVRGECIEYWEALPDSVKGRVHLVSLPTDDTDESAHLVNAVQRRSDVVIQKSLAEGFGLTVAEAMWKHRPTVASAVGGLATQISDGDNGLLIKDPHDGEECATALARLLSDEELATRLGRAGHDSVRDNYLGDRHLLQFADLILRLQ